MALTKVPAELSSTPGIVDNSDATAITIDSSENVTFSGTVSADGGTIVSTGSDAFSSKAVGGYAVQAYQDATSSGHTALDLRSDATTDTRYLIRGYNDAAGTPTEVFSVGADGSAFLNSNVGIGTSSPTRALSVFGDTAGVISITSNSTDGISSLSFGDTADDNAGRVNYLNASDAMLFYTATSERMRITSGGRLLIGTTGGSYTHAKGLRVVSGEVGSHVLDAAVSIEGSGGDFYPINFVGPSNTGFGALAAFSPSTDYLQWQYRNGSGSTNIIRFDANGNVIVTGSLSKGSGSFRIDHPLPAKAETHHLVHSVIEGPQADNIYRGKIDLVDGTANVNKDTAAGMTEGTYALLNTNTQCFTSNESGWTAVKGSVSGNTLTITAQDNTCTDTISWMVVGERKDQHMIDTDWTDENGKVIVEPSKENN